MDTKEPDHYEKTMTTLLHPCNSTSMVNGNGLPLWKDIAGFTCRKDHVIDHVLFSDFGMHNVCNFTLPPWSPELDYRTLCIDIC